MTNLVFDTNFLRNLHKIDKDFSLVDLLCDAYNNRIGVADLQQLRRIDYCICLSDKLQDHNITDEQVISFMLNYKGGINLEHIMDDPVDLKFIVFVKDNISSVFLTCEAKLLQLSKELKLNHWCLKAAIHHLSEHIGGLFGESDYKTEQMFDVNGASPFFHYSKNTRCTQCHDDCPTHKSPPIFET